MIIDEAYCVEMRKVIDIYTAQDFFLTQKSSARLKFLCSFEKCRNTGVKVIGINYDKSVMTSHKFKEPHFRRNSKYSHDNACIWKEITKVVEELKEEIREGKVIASSRPKSSNYIDIFVPKTKGSKSKDSSFYTKLITILGYVSDKQERNRIIKNYHIKTHSKSSLLKKVVNCFLALKTDENRKNTKFSIDKHNTGTFYSLFKHISYYELGEEEKYIYYGGAKVSDTKYNGYQIRFYDKENNKPISLFISKLTLKNCQGQNYLSSVLELVSKSNSYYVDCYFYGKIQNEKNPKFIDVELDHLDNVVLILKSKPSK